MSQITSATARDPKISSYAWLQNFWNECIAPRRGRHWEIATLIDGDIALRDGFAHALVRRCLRERADVSYRYIRAWAMHDDPTPLPPEVDMLFIGRPKPFAVSRLAEFAKRLEGRMYGEFIDPNNGQTGNSVRYANDQGRRVFMEHELEEPFGRYHRCDQDYGILMYRREEVRGAERTLVAIAGLGTLGTLLLTMILSDAAQRKELALQAGTLAPLTPRHLPRQCIELCVRVEVPGEKQLSNLLSALDSPWVEPPFRFQVDAVAVATDDGKEIKIRDVTQTEMELRAAPEDQGGNVRLAHSGSLIALSPQRFALLRRLAEAPEACTREALCHDLGLVGKAPDGRQSVPKIGALLKLVHDLNKALKQDQSIGDRNVRLVHYDKRTERYVLKEVRATFGKVPESVPADGARSVRAGRVTPQPRGSRAPAVTPAPSAPRAPNPQAARRGPGSRSRGR